jgi:WD40 repeat protein
MSLLTPINSKAQNSSISTPQDLAWHPTSPILAIGYKNGTVSFFNISNNTFNTISINYTIYVVKWSLNGSFLAVGTDNGVFLFSWPNFDLIKHVYQWKNQRIFDLEWSNDSSFLYIGSRIKNQSDFSAFFGYNLTNKKQFNINTINYQKSIYCLALHPNQSVIAVSTENTVELRDLKQGQIELQLFINSDPFFDEIPTVVKWNPDGRSLFVMTRGGNVTEWNISSGSIKQQFLLGSRIFNADFSPNGSEIAFTFYNGTKILNYLTSENIIVLKDVHLANTNNIKWSPNGKWLALASHDSSVSIWNTNNFTLNTLIGIQHHIKVLLDSSESLSFGPNIIIFLVLSISIIYIFWFFL